MLMGSLQTSIRLKLTLLVIGAVVLTVAALSLASYTFAHRTLRHEIHERLSVIVSDRQKLLLSYIHQQQERVSLMASRTRFRQLLGEGFDGAGSAEELRRILDDARRSASGIRAIWVTDPDGRVVGATDDSYLGQDLSATKEFMEGRLGPQIYLRHESVWQDTALLAAPALTRPDDRLVGVVMMLTDAHDILEAVSDRKGLGRSGEVLVGMRAGTNIRFFVMGESGTSTMEVPSQRAPAMMEATAGVSGFKPVTDWRGVEVLAAFQPTGYRDWGIVTKIDAVEAYAPIAWLRRLFLSVGAVVLVWGIFVSYALAGRFTRPILRMAGMAESIAKGGLHARVVVESRDEIGRLGTAFNRMTEEVAHSHAILEDRVKQRTEELAKVIAALRQSQEHTRQIIETAHEAFIAINTESIITDWNREAETLFGWSREEIIGRRVTETIIPARYREAHEQGMQRYLSAGEGPVLNKRVEMTARRRDGSEFLAELTIVPVRVGNRLLFNAFLHDISARKQAEEAVTYERQLLQSLMDHSPDRIYFKDLKSRFVRANKATAEFFGVADATLLTGRADVDFFAEEHVRGALEDEQAILKTGNAIVAKEEKETWPDGRVSWASTTKAPWCDATGTIVGTFGISRDITGRKRAEEAVQAAHDLLNSVIENIPNMIFMKDAKDLRFVRFNKAGEELIGSSRSEMIGKSDYDFFPKEEADFFTAKDREVLASGQIVDIPEETIQTRRKGLRILHTKKLPLLKDGKPVYLLGISEDITDRKRAEEQLNRYFSLSPDMFCIADYKGYFKRLNEAWTTVLGYSEEELSAQPFISFVHPEDRAATVAEFDRLLKGDRVVQFDNRYRCKDGSYRWLQWNSVPVLEEQMVHSVARDISEHKRAQELLARFADALNKKNQEMQEDLKMAREVHQIFLSQGYPVFPRTAAPKDSALRFSHRYLPTSALGGDFFEILQLSDRRAGVFICDVMGHGMRAALVTSILRGLIDKYRVHAEHPDRLLAEMNHALMTNLKTVSTTIFATAAYIVFDTATGEMRYANAGHPSPFILRRAAGTIERLDGQPAPHAPALGLVRDAVYPVSTQSLAVHDSVVLFTDGIYEVEGSDGQQFGLDKFQAAVGQRVASVGEPLLDELLAVTRRHSGSGEYSDDVCLVEVELAAKLL